MAEEKRAEERGFVSRWSRRKREAGRARDEVPADEISAQEPSVASEPVSDEVLDEIAARAATEELSPEEHEMLANREAAEAVDIESLAYESDFSVFLKRGVPAALRRKAMRKLWTSNPVLANLDGLNDYDENFADVSGNYFNSLWQVGRGYLTDKDSKASPVASPGGEADDGLPAPTPQDAAIQPETARMQPGENPRNDEAPAESLDEADMAGAEADGAVAEPAPAEQEPEKPAGRVSLRRRVFGGEG